MAGFRVPRKLDPHFIQDLRINPPIPGNGPSLADEYEVMQTDGRSRLMVNISEMNNRHLRVILPTDRGTLHIGLFGRGLPSKSLN